jgi:hypothetical protein
MTIKPKNSQAPQFGNQFKKSAYDPITERFMSPLKKSQALYEVMSNDPKIALVVSRTNAME